MKKNTLNFVTHLLLKILFDLKQFIKSSEIITKLNKDNITFLFLMA